MYSKQHNMHLCCDPSGDMWLASYVHLRVCLNNLHCTYGWEVLCTEITCINTFIKLTPRSMCRTVDRQFPPSHKVTLKKENSVLLYYGKMQIGHTHTKITACRKKWKIRHNITSSGSCNPFNKLVTYSSSYQCIFLPDLDI